MPTFASLLTATTLPVTNTLLKLISSGIVQISLQTRDRLSGWITTWRTADRYYGLVPLGDQDLQKQN